MIDDILVQEHNNNLFGQFEDNVQEEIENKSIEARRIALKKVCVHQKAFPILGEAKKTRI